MKDMPDLPEPIRQLVEFQDRAFDEDFEQQRIIEAQRATIARLWAMLDRAMALAESRQDPAAKARAVRSLRTDMMEMRARELKAAGLSAARIGMRLATEDGRPGPYSERQVRRWVRGRRNLGPTDRQTGPTDRASA